MTEFYQESAVKTRDKKIAIVVCAWPPQGGGMGNNAYYHAQKISQKGYSVSVFTPRTINSLDETNNKIVRRYKLEYLWSWLQYGSAGFLFSLMVRLKDSDVIHLYYPFFGTDLLVWLYKILHPGKKLVLHYQMDPVGRGWQKIFFWLYLKLFLGLIVGVSDKVIILSWDHAAGSYLKKYLQQKEKFVVVPNAIDIENFKPQDKNLALAKKYNLAADDLVLIFVGGLDRQHYFKGLEVLMAAIKNIKVKLLVVGDGDLKKHYQNFASKWGINDKVIFVGWVKNEELSQYYSLADIFVLPSTARTESFGIVTAEAQACGIPALVSNWPGSRETIKDGTTGLVVKPGSVRDLENKINFLLTDDELRKRMGVAAAARARDLYSWDLATKVIDDIYQKL